MTGNGRVVAGAPIPRELLASRLRAHRVPGASVAVVREGVLDWARGYGVRTAGEVEPVGTSTLFQAASISKPVTAVAALRLVEAGVLALDESVNQVLRVWKLPENEFTLSAPVTLRGLLSHSAGVTVSGFPGYGAGAKLPSLVEVLDGREPANSAAVRVDAVPGTMVRYSGGGYTVLQQMMIDATLTRFPALMCEEVLRRVGMPDSTFEQPLPRECQCRAAAGHGADGVVLDGLWHVYPEMAAAGLWTTPTDLAVFAVELWRASRGVSDALLPAHLAKTMLERQAGDQGLGVSLPGGGVPRFEHGGANAGYRCFMAMSIERGDGIVVMTNGDSGDAVIAEVVGAVVEAYGWVG